MINCENLLKKIKEYYIAWWNCEVLNKIDFKESHKLLYEKGWES